MADLNYSNVLARTASAKGMNLVEIFTEDDFPAPSGGVISLVNNTKYRIRAPITVTSPFNVDGVSVEIESDFNTVNTLTYLGTGAMFRATDLRSFILRLLITFNATGSQLFDLTSVTPFTSIVAVLENRFFGFPSLGNIDGVATLAFLDSQFILFGSGLTVDSADTIVNMTTIALTNLSDSGSTFFSFNGTFAIMQFRDLLVNPFAGESAHLITHELQKLR